MKKDLRGSTEKTDPSARIMNRNRDVKGVLDSGWVTDVTVAVPKNGTQATRVEIAQKQS